MHPRSFPFLVLAACGRDPEPTPPEAEVTWAAVAPIYARSCVGCHQAGGIAPFRLDDPVTAAAWASSSAAAVATRTMPPFLVTGDGTCGEWADEEWLTDEQIATVGAWADAGAPLGPDPAPIASPPVLALPSIGLSAAIPPYLPALGGEVEDEYRCFLIENEADVDTWLTGYAGTPGRPEIVHHLAVYTVEGAGGSYVEGLTNAELVAGHDAADPSDGWACFGAAGEGVRHSGTPATWAPGQGAVLYPDGSAFRLRPGHDLVLQVHYHHDGVLSGGADASRVDFSTAPSAERELWSVPADAFLRSWVMSQYGLGESASIPAGEPAWQYTFPVTGAEMLADGGFDPAEPRPFELVGVMPHMHERGRKQWVTLAPEETCAMEVGDWDFHWQRVYFWADGIPMDGASEVAVTCEWDASDATEDVLPGWSTGTEMCLATLLLTTDVR